MSYDPAGNYSLPPVYKAEPGTTIRSQQHNDPLEDIAQALSFVLVRDGRAGMLGNLPMGGFRITNLAPGSSPTDGATVAQAALIGEIKEWGLKSLPSGFLWCDGSALLSNTPYPLLRQALLADGSPWGTDGNGNPRVPDYRGRVGAGRDTMGGTAAERITSSGSGINGRTLGASGGSETHTLTRAQMPAHSHGAGGLRAASHNHPTTLGARVQGTPTGTDYARIQLGMMTQTSTFSFNTGNSGPLVVSGSTANDGSGSAHNNVQPTLIVNKIIRGAY